MPNINVDGFVMSYYPLNDKRLEFQVSVLAYTRNAVPYQIVPVFCGANCSGSCCITDVSAEYMSRVDVQLFCFPIRRAIERLERL